MGRSEGLFYLIYKGDMKGNLSAYGMYFIVMKASLTVSIKVTIIAIITSSVVLNMTCKDEE